MNDQEKQELEQEMKVAEKQRAAIMERIETLSIIECHFDGCGCGQFKPLWRDPGQCKDCGHGLEWHVI